MQPGETRRPLREKLTQQPSLHERAYRALREAIIERRLVGGERLVESSLAEDLGVSRSPVREALRRLQQDGLVEARPGGGYVVASVTPKEIDDFYRLRAALSGVAAALAAERITYAEIAELEEYVDRMDRAIDADDDDELIEASDGFHEAITDAARNPRLSGHLNLLHAQVNHFRSKTLRLHGRAKVAVEGHRAILQAIRARDGQRGEMLMRAHVEEARQELRRHVAEIGVQDGDGRRT